MARKNVIYSSTNPYHLGGKTNRGEFFPLSLDKAWEIFEDELFISQKLYQIEIYAFVLMSNHFHLLLRTPRANISEFAGYFMKKTSFHINDLSGNENHLWGKRNHKTLVTSDIYFQVCRKYIYRNPVKAGLSKTCLEYPYSTLGSSLGFRKQIFEVVEWPELHSDTEEILSWLDTKPNEELSNSFERALKKVEIRKIQDENKKLIDFSKY